METGVDEDEEGIEHERRQGDKAERDAQRLAASLGNDHAGHEKGEEEKHANGEHHGQEMHQLQALGVFLVKVDARYATVEHLPPELAEVGAALVVDPSCLLYTSDAADE